MVASMMDVGGMRIGRRSVAVTGGRPHTPAAEAQVDRIHIRSPWDRNDASSAPITALAAPPHDEPSPTVPAQRRWSLAGILALSMVSGFAPLNRAMAADPPPATMGMTVQATAADTTALPSPNAISRTRVDAVEINARIERTAEKVGLPADLLKAVAWQESSWTHIRASGRLVTQANRDADGDVSSVDSGIMQINDKAHPEAFPRARSLDGNLLYGARLLNEIVERWGVDGVWHYNGNPAYQQAIRSHLTIRPWTAEIMRAEVRALTVERQTLEQDVSRETRALQTLEKKVETAHLNADQWDRKVERATTPAAHRAAERDRSYARTLVARAEAKMTQARQKLDSDRDRLQALPSLITEATARTAAESARVKAAERALHGTGQMPQHKSSHHKS